MGSTTPTTPTKPITETRVFRILLFTLMALVVVWVGSQVGFVFRPLVVVVSTLFVPVAIAGVLFFLFAPLVNLMNRGRFPRVAAILVVYVVLGGSLTLAIILAVPILQYQIAALIDNTPRLANTTRGFIEELSRNGLIVQWLPDIAEMARDLPARAAELVRTLYGAISANLSGLIGFVANLVVILTTVPFVLFFMLKDGGALPDKVAWFFPDDYRTAARTIMVDMGTTLGMYIKGQMIVSLFVGVMLLIGYLVVGVNYALLLATVALFTNLIPYVGPIIGTVPGLIVALMDSPSKMLQVLVLVFVVQQVESQLVSPFVMGKQLRIHPLMIIFLLLTAGSLAGFVGLLLAVPAYAVTRTAVVYVYRLVVLRKEAMAAPTKQQSTTHAQSPPAGGATAPEPSAPEPSAATPSETEPAGTPPPSDPPPAVG